MSEGPFRETAVVAEKTYNFLLWLLPEVEKLPRSFRLTVGDWAVGMGLDLLSESSPQIAILVSMAS